MLHRSTPRRATGLTFALFASVLAALTVLVGPSSGAALFAAIQVAGDMPPSARVVVVCPDGGERYVL